LKPSLPRNSARALLARLQATIIEQGTAASESQLLSDYPLPSRRQSRDEDFRQFSAAFRLFLCKPPLQGLDPVAQVRAGVELGMRSNEGIPRGLLRLLSLHRWALSPPLPLPSEHALRLRTAWDAFRFEDGAAGANNGQGMAAIRVGLPLLWVVNSMAIYGLAWKHWSFASEVPQQDAFEAENSVDETKQATDEDVLRGGKGEGETAQPPNRNLDGEMELRSPSPVEDISDSISEEAAEDKNESGDEEEAGDRDRRAISSDVSAVTMSEGEVFFSEHYSRRTSGRSTAVSPSKTAFSRSPRAMPLRGAGDVPPRSARVTPSRSSKKTSSRSHKVTPPRSLENTPLQSHDVTSPRSQKKATSRSHEAASPRSPKKTPSGSHVVTSPRSPKRTPSRSHEVTSPRSPKKTPSGSHVVTSPRSPKKTPSRSHELTPARSPTPERTAVPSGTWSSPLHESPGRMGGMEGILREDEGKGLHVHPSGEDAAGTLRSPAGRGKAEASRRVDQGDVLLPRGKHEATRFASGKTALFPQVQQRGAEANGRESGHPPPGSAAASGVGQRVGESDGGSDIKGTSSSLGVADEHQHLLGEPEVPWRSAATHKTIVAGAGAAEAAVKARGVQRISGPGSALVSNPATGRASSPSAMAMRASPIKVTASQHPLGGSAAESAAHASLIAEAGKAQAPNVLSHVAPVPDDTLRQRSSEGSRAAQLASPIEVTASQHPLAGSAAEGTAHVDLIDEAGVHNVLSRLVHVPDDTQRQRSSEGSRAAQFDSEQEQEQAHEQARDEDVEFQADLGQQSPRREFASGAESLLPVSSSTFDGARRSPTGEPSGFHFPMSPSVEDEGEERQTKRGTMPLLRLKRGTEGRSAGTLRPEPTEWSAAQRGAGGATSLPWDAQGAPDGSAGSNSWAPGPGLSRQHAWAAQQPVGPAQRVVSHVLQQQVGSTAPPVASLPPRWRGLRPPPGASLRRQILPTRPGPSRAPLLRLNQDKGGPAPPGRQGRPMLRLARSERPPQDDPTLVFGDAGAYQPRELGRPRDTRRHGGPTQGVVSDSALAEARRLHREQKRRRSMYQETTISWQSVASSSLTAPDDGTPGRGGRRVPTGREENTVTRPGGRNQSALPQQMAAPPCKGDVGEQTFPDKRGATPAAAAAAAAKSRATQTLSPDPRVEAFNRISQGVQATVAQPTGRRAVQTQDGLPPDDALLPVAFDVHTSDLLAALELRTMAAMEEVAARAAATAAATAARGRDSAAGDAGRLTASRAADDAVPVREEPRLPAMRQAGVDAQTSPVPQLGSSTARRAPPSRQLGHEREVSGRTREERHTPMNPAAAYGPEVLATYRLEPRAVREFLGVEEVFEQLPDLQELAYMEGGGAAGGWPGTPRWGRASAGSSVVVGASGTARWSASSRAAVRRMEMRHDVRLVYGGPVWECGVGTFELKRTGRAFLFTVNFLDPFFRRKNTWKRWTTTCGSWSGWRNARRCNRPRFLTCSRARGPLRTALFLSRVHLFYMANFLRVNEHSKPSTGVYTTAVGCLRGFDGYSLMRGTPWRGAVVGQVAALYELRLVGDGVEALLQTLQWRDSRNAGGG
jgi:hypothetical protein